MTETHASKARPQTPKGAPRRRLAKSRQSVSTETNVASGLAVTIEDEIGKLPERERDAAREAMARHFARPQRFKIEFTTGEDGQVKYTPRGGPTVHSLRLRDVFGTSSSDFAIDALSKLAGLLTEPGQEHPDNADICAAIAAVEGIGPQNEAEAMLAVQMVATHIIAMRMLGRAGGTGDMGRVQTYGTFATKLLRTYTTQMEAMAKSRRGGSQKVVVEHVHVYQGGQAIVGAVTSGGGGAQLENGHHPHATDDMRALALAGGAAERRRGPERNAGHRRSWAGSGAGCTAEPPEAGRLRGAQTRTTGTA